MRIKRGVWKFFDWRKIWRFGVFSTPDCGIGTDFLFLGPPVFFTRAMERFGEVANRRRRRKSGFTNNMFIVFVPNRGAVLMPGSRCVCSQGIAELRVSSLDKVVLRGRSTATVLQILFGFSRCRFSFSRSGGLSFPAFRGATAADGRFVASFSPRGGNLLNKTSHCGRVSLFRLVFKEKSILSVKVFENSLRLGGGVFLRRAVA